MKSITKIMGERIFLEPLTKEHVSESYLQWMQDDDILQYLTGTNGGYNFDELKKYVEQMEESSYNYLFGIFLKETNMHIGNIKIGNIDSADQSGDLGLIIGDKNIWGKGYGAEAIILATQYAFNELNLNKLIAGMVTDNVGSYKAFMKAGYKKVGGPTQKISFKGRDVDTISVEKCKDSRS